MNRALVLSVLALSTSGCLDPLTSFTLAPVTAPDAGRPMTTPDAGQVDVKVVDAGVSVDAGSMSVDAGSMSVDAGGSCVVGTVTDCSACGDTCAVVAHAESTCVANVCGRGACEAGWFDLDPTVPGCETHCEGTQCTLPDGGVVVVTSPPVSERGVGELSVSGHDPVTGSEMGAPGAAQATGSHVHGALLH